MGNREEEMQQVVEATRTPKRDPGHPYGVFDAREWAREFMRLFGDRLNEVDEGLMLGWFAGAIMTGYDTAHQEHAHEAGG